MSTTFLCGVKSAYRAQPSQWDEYFDGKDDLLATLDRLFDKARVFMIKGDSYRGRECETLAVEAGSVTELKR